MKLIVAMLGVAIFYGVIGHQTHAFVEMWFGGAFFLVGLAILIVTCDGLLKKWTC